MKIIWLGHSGFRMEIGDQILLVDPWFNGNPMFPADRRAEVIAGVTHILVSHGHGDHAGDSVALSRETGAPLIGIYDLMEWFAARDGVETVGFNRGGTVQLGTVAVTLVAASHSSSIDSAQGPIYAGSECGFMIAGEGQTIYFSGDTDIMADMDWMGDFHKPTIGILASGGHFTMDMARAAYAARRYFNFKTVIPCHYRTFPLLAQDAKILIDRLLGVDVIEPQILDPITL